MLAEVGFELLGAFDATAREAVAGRRLASSVNAACRTCSGDNTTGRERNISTMFEVEHTITSRAQPATGSSWWKQRTGVTAAPVVELTM